MSNRLKVGLRGNDIDKVFQRLGLNAQVTARLMGKGLAEAAKDVKNHVKPRLPIGRIRYIKVGGVSRRVGGGKLRQSVRSRRVARSINGVRVSGSGAVAGYGLDPGGDRGNTAFYAHFLEYGTGPRKQRKTGRVLGKISRRRYLERTVQARRNYSEAILLRETRKELVKQIRLAKGGFKSLDRTLLRHF